MISELRKGSHAHPRFVDWAKTEHLNTSLLSAVTVFEIERGALLKARRDSVQGRTLSRWVDDVLSQFRGRILPYDAVVAKRCAALHVPDPRPERDAIIAATALVHDLTLVTRNTRDFEPMGVRLLNPWESGR